MRTMMISGISRQMIAVFTCDIMTQTFGLITNLCARG